MKQKLQSKSSTKKPRSLGLGKRISSFFQTDSFRHREQLTVSNHEKLRREGNYLSNEASAKNSASKPLLLINKGLSSKQSRRQLTPAQARILAIKGVQANETALPYLDRIQPLFGSHDIKNVRAHIGGAARKASHKLGAMAYATGKNIAFDNAPDLRTAAHEAAHVVKQRRALQFGLKIPENAYKYEQNASDVAHRVVAGRSAEDLLGSPEVTLSRFPAKGDTIQYATRNYNDEWALVYGSNEQVIYAHYLGDDEEPLPPTSEQIRNWLFRNVSVAQDRVQAITIDDFCETPTEVEYSLEIEDDELEEEIENLFGIVRTPYGTVEAEEGESTEEAARLYESWAAPVAEDVRYKVEELITTCQTRAGQAFNSASEDIRAQADVRQNTAGLIFELVFVWAAPSAGRLISNGLRRWSRSSGRTANVQFGRATRSRVQAERLEAEAQSFGIRTNPPGGNAALARRSEGSHTHSAERHVLSGRFAANVRRFGERHADQIVDNMKGAGAQAARSHFSEATSAASTSASPPPATITRIQSSATQQGLRLVHEAVVRGLEREKIRFVRNETNLERLYAYYEYHSEYLETWDADTLASLFVDLVECGGIPENIENICPQRRLFFEAIHSRMGERAFTAIDPTSCTYRLAAAHQCRARGYSLAPPQQTEP